MFCVNALFKFKKATGEDLADVITGVKHSSLTWLKDNSGLFYCRYPDHKVFMIYCYNRWFRVARKELLL